MCEKDEYLHPIIGHPSTLHYGPLGSSANGLADSIEETEDSPRAKTKKSHNGMSCQSHEPVFMMRPMKVHLSHPTRDVVIQGPKRVADIFKELNLIPEAFLIIRGQDLMTEDETVADGDSIEIRPVISGG